MRAIRLSSGEEIMIVRDGDVCPEGNVCFSQSEWAWAQKLAAAKHDPAEQKELLVGLVETKKIDPKISVFDLFPKEGGGLEAPLTPTLQGASAAQACAQGDSTARARLDSVANRRESEAARLARKYNGEIQASFRGRRA